MLLCIEMAFFSIFHLWAFPWRVYDIRRSEIVVAESAPGFLPDPKTAYSGGPFGVNALMDAFNPWDLVKNVGRGFKWFAVGRRTRMDDISYKNSHSTGLEPTRNQLTAFDTAGNNSLDAGPEPYESGRKPGRYTPLDPDEDDTDQLLTHAQTNPSDSSPKPPYPRPMERLQHGNPSTGGDIGTMGIYDPPPPAKAGAAPYSHNTNSNHLPYPSTPQESGIIDPSHSTQSQQSLDPTQQDTSYHSPTVASLASTATGTAAAGKRTVTPTTLPPDPHPLGPPGRRSYDDGVEEWDLWGGGTRESERDLGGGHGVGDNRF